MLFSFSCALCADDRRFRINTGFTGKPRVSFVSRQPCSFSVRDPSLLFPVNPQPRLASVCGEPPQGWEAACATHGLRHHSYGTRGSVPAGRLRPVRHLLEIVARRQSARPDLSARLAEDSVKAYAQKKLPNWGAFCRRQRVLTISETPYRSRTDT